MATILLTGASGFVGSHVAPALLEAGHHVRALVRSRDSADRVSARLDDKQRAALAFVTGDITDPASLAPALAGVEGVVHLVAIPRDWSKGRDLARVNTDGTRDLLEAMRQAGVERLIHLSALFAPAESGPPPDSLYVRSKVDGEAAVRASGLRWTILRPSVMWGERDGYFNTMATLVRMTPGFASYPARVPGRAQPLAVTDLARIIVICLADEATVGRAFDLGGPRVMGYGDLLDEVLRGMGARRVRVPVPVSLMKVTTRGAEALHLPFPVASDQLKLLAESSVAGPDVVRREFGFEPQAMDGRLGYLRKRRADQ